MPCSPGMIACRLRNPGCPHLRFVRDYGLAREAAVAKRDADTLGYATELEAYPPIVTFKSYLVDMVGWSGGCGDPGRPLSAQPETRAASRDVPTASPGQTLQESA